jgi:hypothetical protein
MPQPFQETSNLCERKGKFELQLQKELPSTYIYTFGINPTNICNIPAQAITNEKNTQTNNVLNYIAISNAETNYQEYYIKKNKNLFAYLKSNEISNYNIRITHCLDFFYLKFVNTTYINSWANVLCQIILDYKLYGSLDFQYSKLELLYHPELFYIYVISILLFLSINHDQNGRQNIYTRYLGLAKIRQNFINKFFNLTIGILHDNISAIEEIFKALLSDCAGNCKFNDEVFDQTCNGNLKSIVELLVKITGTGIYYCDFQNSNQGIPINNWVLCSGNGQSNDVVMAFEDFGSEVFSVHIFFNKYQYMLDSKNENINWSYKINIQDMKKLSKLNKSYVNDNIDSTNILCETDRSSPDKSRTSSFDTFLEYDFKNNGFAGLAKYKDIANDIINDEKKSYSIEFKLKGIDQYDIIFYRIYRLRKSDQTYVNVRDSNLTKVNENKEFVFDRVEILEDDLIYENSDHTCQIILFSYNKNIQIGKGFFYSDDLSKDGFTFTIELLNQVNKEAINEENKSVYPVNLGNDNKSPKRTFGKFFYNSFKGFDINVVFAIDFTSSNENLKTHSESYHSCSNEYSI